MKSEDLLRAIGELEEERLERSEFMALRKPRILWKAALIAGIISCLAVTAVATVAAVIRGRAEVNEQTIHHAQENCQEETYTMDILEVFVDWPMKADAPRVLERFYVPAVLETEKLEGCSYGFGDDEQTDIYSFELHWGYGDDGEYIEFFQKTGFSYNPENPVDIKIGVPEDMVISTETVVLGEREYFQVNVVDWFPQKRLYWTDGHYIFCLACPSSMPMVEVQRILGSMEEVTDFSAYMEKAFTCVEANRQKQWGDFLRKMTSDEPYEMKTAVESGWLIEDNQIGTVGVGVELILDENAPDTIERIVVPRLFEDWQFSGRSWSENGGMLLSHTVYWKVPDFGEGSTVSFTQECGSFRYQHTEEIDRIIDAKEGVTVESGITVLGNYRLYEVYYEQNERGGPGERCFYWTDGSYIFGLHCPYGMENSEILEILNSIR